MARIDPVNPAIAAPAGFHGRTWFGRLLDSLLLLLVLTGIGLFGLAVRHFIRNAAAPKPPVAPHTMAEVDWTSPNSSVYCLSCHWNVGLAAAGLDVQRGHSHNVPLNEVQRRAVRDMGTLAGPGNTLICLSCHTLKPEGHPYMLAETLVDSHLCERCHPGHYARRTPHDLRESAPDERNRRGQTAAEGGPCSACHLAHTYARVIIPSPLDPDGWCITCHRTYGVAAEHAHMQIMQHPESHCLQCHDAHNMNNGAFLRQETPALCVECHAQYDGGVARGMHTVGAMTMPMPQVLLDAGASAGAGGVQITCATCHLVHDAGCDDLLVLSDRTNELCLACHAGMLSEHGGGALSRHGQRPVLDAGQRTVVARWGMPVGDEGELLCVSCHKVHHAEPEAHLLAAPPRFSDTCVACHPGEARVFGTPHDLTLKFPDAQNRAGQTPAESGPCSACHMTHMFAREFTPGPGDPDGKCMSCHLAGRIAQAKHTSGVEHPDTRCLDCHNPHDRAHGRFLLQPEAQLCTSCHQEEAKLRGGPHDITQAQRPERWSPAARAQDGLCLSCHVPHGGERPDLFRVGVGEAIGNHDDVCLACHAETAWNAPTLGAIHPQQISPDQDKVALALVPRGDGGELRMGCRTCHDPHGGVTPVHLARVAAGEPTEVLCLHCHEDKQYIRFTGHSPERLAELDIDTDSCKPCHAMHADRAGSWGTMLSARFLPPLPEGENAAQGGPCRACHHENGLAPFQRFATHPPRQLASIGKDYPGHLPLFNAEGHEDPQGEVECRTCHLSHGRLDLLKEIAENPEWTEAKQHAVRAQLRPFLEPNTCSACHGAQARLLFLRFHDPRARSQAHIPVP